MAIRFNRRFRIVPGVRLNLGKRGVSASVGHRGSWLTFGSRGTVRSSVGLTGTGLYWTEDFGGRRLRAAGRTSTIPMPSGSPCLGPGGRTRQKQILRGVSV